MRGVCDVGVEEGMYITRDFRGANARAVSTRGPEPCVTTNPDDAYRERIRVKSLTTVTLIVATWDGNSESCCCLTCDVASSSLSVA
jgi:hypothetical protein